MVIAEGIHTAKVLTMDEARRVASNIAKLPTPVAHFGLADVRRVR
jgi:hypothetical protein